MGVDTYRNTFFNGLPRRGSVAFDGTCVVVPPSIPRKGDTWCENLAAQMVRPDVKELLQALDLNRCQLGDFGLQKLANKLKATDTSYANLAVLNLSWNNLTEHSVDALLALLSQCPSLQRVELANNHFNTGALEVVCNYIAKRESITQAHLGVTSSRHPKVQELGEVLYKRHQNATAEQRGRERGELEKAQQAHKNWKTQLERERRDMEDDETRCRKGIEVAEQTGLRSVVKEKNKWMQTERSRRQSEEATRLQQKKEQRQDMEDDETSHRLQIDREQETERKHLLFAEESSRDKIKVSLEHKDTREKLVNTYHEQREKSIRTEKTRFTEIVSKFAKRLEQVMTIERRNAVGAEREARAVVAKEQEDTRKGVVKSFRSEKQDVKMVDTAAVKRRDVWEAEQKVRNDVSSAEDGERRHMLQGEEVDRKKAKDAMYKADGGDLGLLRVVSRKEAYHRLEIDDEQDAERQMCYIGYLMDVPGTHSEMHVAAMDRLKQQQAEEFAIRARARSLRMMEDLSVLNFSVLITTGNLTSSFVLPQELADKGDWV